MTDDVGPGVFVPPTPAAAAPGGTYPPSNFPVVFADGVMSIANSAVNVKFYLARSEPSFSGDGSSVNQAFAQVIMPMDGFATMFTFFEVAIAKYITDGLIRQERVEELRDIQKRGNPFLK
jgi:hypothetical protein